MGRKRPLTSRGAKTLAEREREVGLENDDEAAKWLAKHDPQPAPTLSKAARKSKTLHQWRRRRQQER